MSFIALLEAVSEKEERRLQEGRPAGSLQHSPLPDNSANCPSISSFSEPFFEHPRASVFQQRLKDAQACHVQRGFTKQHISEPESHAVCQAQPIEHYVNESRPTHLQHDPPHKENSRTCTNTGVTDQGLKEQKSVPNIHQECPIELTSLEEREDHDANPHSPVKYSLSLTENLPDSLEMLAEEERMRRIQAEKARAQADKSMAIEAKAQKAKERARDLQERQRAESEQQRRELELRMEVAAGRREEDLKLRRIRGEERRLRLADAQAEKDRIARLHGYRRERLQAQLDAKQERLDLFLALNDQFRDQRRQSALKGCMAPRLKSFVDLLPGPGHYDANPSTIATAPAPKIGGSRSTSAFEKLAIVAHANPPPGAYFT